MAFDNAEEINKIRKHAPHAGLILRIRVPNTGSMVELSSKFGAAPGEAVDLIAAASDAGLTVEGMGFHVGSQCTNFENYVQALSISASIMEEAEARGLSLKLLDIGGGFPARYDRHVRPFRELARILQRRTELALISEEPGNSGGARPIHGGHDGNTGSRGHRQIRA